MFAQFFFVKRGHDSKKHNRETFWNDLFRQNMRCQQCRKNFVSRSAYRRLTFGYSIFFEITRKRSLSERQSNINFRATSSLVVQCNIYLFVFVFFFTLERNARTSAPILAPRFLFPKEDLRAYLH